MEERQNLCRMHSKGSQEVKKHIHTEITVKKSMKKKERIGISGRSLSSDSK
jgi:hypothetical protein